VIARPAGLVAAFLLLAVPLAAQDAEPPAGVPVVQYLDIIREDIADSNETGFAAKAANALHVRTRQRVVEREVLLKPGMPYDSVLAAETARNLRALGIFRDVLVDTVRSDSGLTLRVVTKDGWSTFPIFNINTAAGQSAFALGAAEGNLLGLAALGLIRYSSNPDRTAWLFAFRQPRVFAGRVNLGLSVDERSDGRAIAGQLGMPFYSIASRWALGGDATYFNGDVLVFANGVLTPDQTLSRQYTLVSVDGARALKASPRGYVRAGVTAQLESNSFLPSPVTVPRFDTTQVAVGAYVNVLRARFALARNVRSFGRAEDFAIGQNVRVGLLAAPSAFGYAVNGVGLQVAASTGFRFPGGLAQLSATANGLVTGAGVDSGSVVLKGNLVVQPNTKNAIIVGGFVGRQKNPVPGRQFDLGLVYGLRAYPLHAFVGDRGFLVAAEYRWTFTENFGGLLGLALGTFVDYGGAWYAGESPRTGADLGAGLRFGPSRSASPVLFRLDLAYRFEAAPFTAGWSIVFGQGFTF
jgi:hypothetical protein